jgi:broad specificity phosphatase PhoE
MMTTGTSSRAAKDEGSIADIFTSLTNEEHNALPDRFSDLKRELWTDGMIESWRQVLAALEPAVEEVVAQGSEV